MNENNNIAKRITFAIISHPDAGKTTLTEKLLLYGGAIGLAGTIKGRKATRAATADWMRMEQERGISVTTSVMQFPYQDYLFNLLDTPGHEDFSEDTYRTLTAVDSALMVIDAARGVEARTIKLMEVCRLRSTPIVTFINKLDRQSRDPLALLDEIEKVLGITCAPLTWPLGMGSDFKGVYHLADDTIHLFSPGSGAHIKEANIIKGLHSKQAQQLLDSFMIDEVAEAVSLLSDAFCVEDFLQGRCTPVLFGSAMNNFGVQSLLDTLWHYAPAAQSRQTKERLVEPTEKKFSGFVFKVQANMDPKHRDRIAFLRVCSGAYTAGMKMYHVRAQRMVNMPQALTFLAQERSAVNDARVGDIIGLYNRGTIRIGDSFTQGELLHFVGIPHFAPELFRSVRLRDPLRSKQLLKGLLQLGEEGASQLFRPKKNNELILGAVGELQFDVVAQRLKEEYQVDCIFDSVNIAAARWVVCDEDKIWKDFLHAMHDYLALDGANALTYLAPSRVNLQLAQERWPQVKFLATRDI